LSGAEKLGIKSISHLKTATDVVVVIRGGRADLNGALKQVQGKKLIGMGVFLEKEISTFSLVLPGLAFTEKEGTIINHAGIEQKIKRAIVPKNTVKAVSEVLMLAANKKAKEAVV
jgi:predicted molibdopterin-dependent oxidoreductase YjgC